MGNSYEEEEHRIKEALDVYTSSKNQKLAALAREYRVPYYRLRARFHGRPSKIGKQKSLRLLTEAQEGAILRIINSLRRYNIKLNRKDIEDLANLLL
jgi:hypothetical protein